MSEQTKLEKLRTERIKAVHNFRKAAAKGDSAAREATESLREFGRQVHKVQNRPLNNLNTDHNTKETK